MKKGKKPAVPVTTSTSSAASTPAPSTAEEDNMAFQYENMMVLDDTMASGSSSAAGPSVPGPRGRVKRKKSVKSETSIELKGPMEVDGSVKSGAGITFSGDFAVRDRIEAYGNIDVNGNLNCKYVPTLPVHMPPLPVKRKIGDMRGQDKANRKLRSNKIKSFGNVHINGSGVCRCVEENPEHPLQSSRPARS